MNGGWWCCAFARIAAASPAVAGGRWWSACYRARSEFLVGRVRSTVSRSPSRGVVGSSGRWRRRAVRGVVTASVTARGGVAFARCRRLVVSTGGGASRSRGAVARRWWGCPKAFFRCDVAVVAIGRRALRMRCPDIVGGGAFIYAHLRVFGVRAALARLPTPTPLRRLRLVPLGDVVVRGRFPMVRCSLPAPSSASSPPAPGRCRFFGCVTHGTAQTRLSLFSSLSPFGFLLSPAFPLLSSQLRGSFG